MNRLDSLRPITRRALRINYRSPLICTPAISSGSGSSGTSTIEAQPAFRAAGTTAKACPTQDGDVVLEWFAIQNAFAYVVYRSDSPNGIFTVIGSGFQDTFFTDTARIPGTYYYKVTGIEPNFGETEPSNTVSATI